MLRLGGFIGGFIQDALKRRRWLSFIPAFAVFFVLKVFSTAVWRFGWKWNWCFDAVIRSFKRQENLKRLRKLTCYVTDYLDSSVTASNLALTTFAVKYIGIILLRQQLHRVVYLFTQKAMHIVLIFGLIVFIPQSMYWWNLIHCLWVWEELAL